MECEHVKHYCKGCIFCRPLGSFGGPRACHYYLDTGLKPPYTKDGCSAHKVLDDEARAHYLANLRDTGYSVSPKKRLVEDDYIFDSRGALDGWYPTRDE